MHRRCQSLAVEDAENGADAGAIDGHVELLARDLPETALHIASRCPTTQTSAVLLTCAVVWGRGVLHGDVNHRRIYGKDAVRQSALRLATAGQSLLSVGRPLLVRIRPTQASWRSCHSSTAAES